MAECLARSKAFWTAAAAHFESGSGKEAHAFGGLALNRRPHHDEELVTASNAIMPGIELLEEPIDGFMASEWAELGPQALLHSLRFLGESFMPLLGNDGLDGLDGRQTAPLARAQQIVDAVLRSGLALLPQVPHDRNPHGEVLRETKQ